MSDFIAYDESSEFTQEQYEKFRQFHKVTEHFGVVIQPVCGESVFVIYRNKAKKEQQFACGGRRTLKEAEAACRYLEVLNYGHKDCDRFERRGDDEEE